MSTRGRRDGVDGLVMLPHLLTERVPTIRTTKAMLLARVSALRPGCGHGGLSEDGRGAAEPKETCLWSPRRRGPVRPALGLRDAYRGC